MKALVPREIDGGSSSSLGVLVSALALGAFVSGRSGC